MNNNNIPVHSTATLVKASGVAAVIAAVVLVCFVLPAEYDVDPTGIGKTLGLTKLAQVSVTVPSAPVKQQSSVLEKRSDTVEVVVPPKRGIEYKLLMEKHANMTYDWKTTAGEPLYFDFHGEPRGDTTGYFKSFSITTSNQMKGSLTTPFAGSHGWYWKNTSDVPITVTLNVSGQYSIKG